MFQDTSDGCAQLGLSEWCYKALFGIPADRFSVSSLTALQSSALPLGAQLSKCPAGESRHGLGLQPLPHSQCSCSGETGWGWGGRLKEDQVEQNHLTLSSYKWDRMFHGTANYRKPGKMCR